MGVNESEEEGEKKKGSTKVGREAGKEMMKERIEEMRGGTRKGQPGLRGRGEGVVGMNES